MAWKRRSAGAASAGLDATADGAKEINDARERVAVSVFRFMVFLGGVAVM
jgi:hypothetical protein